MEKVKLLIKEQVQNIRTIKFRSRESQKALVLAHLLKGKTITPLDALQLYGSLRLGAIIFDLRQAGHPIITNDLDLGNNQIVAEYVYNPGALGYILGNNIDFLKNVKK